MTIYQEAIQRQYPELTERECAYVEAWMRLEHPSLNGVSPDTFRREVNLSVICLRQVALEENEALALSFGL